MNISVFGSKFRIGFEIPTPTSPISDTSHHFHDIGMKLIIVISAQLHIRIKLDKQHT